ncbi:MAG: heparinase II/III domain-containing protein, partial [Gammaproteobacteria bacterium]
MQSLGWYWNRLNRMSPAEVAYRARKAAVNHAQRVGLLAANKVAAPDLSRPQDKWLAVAPDIDPKPYVDAAEQVIDGKIRVFALADAQLGTPPRWNRDPRTGIEAPLLFGKSIDYRDERVVGDIKYLWEPNRHLQLVTLAQAYRLTGSRRYLDALATQLSSWFRQCPYLKGPNWTSSLELGIRLINWSIVWRLIGGAESPIFEREQGVRLREDWLRCVYQHVHFIGNHYSKFSSANNHLIGEAAGVFVAACTWPCWDAMSAWRGASQDLLVAECEAQTHPDGVNKEQAVSYQQFVLDFLLLSGLAARARGIELPPSYWQRIEAMLEFVAAVMDVAGNVPMIGDADDGYAVRLSPEPGFCPYRSLLATGATLFEREDFRRKAASMDHKTLWLIGAGAAKERDATAPATARYAFPDGGYYVLGCDPETPREIKLVVDCGPLGYLSLAAHGHADALAFTLSLGGREFLVDPGTYAYHTGRLWRDYFRGTAAHNTVMIDG